MNKILSTSVTPAQEEIIKKIAAEIGCSTSSLLKESLQLYVGLYYAGKIVNKIGLEEKTTEVIERNSTIKMHLEEVTKLMEPVLEQTLSEIPLEVIRTLEEDGKFMENTLKEYNKPVKLGRPPEIAARKSEATK